MILLQKAFQVAYGTHKVEEHPQNPTNDDRRNKVKSLVKSHLTVGEGGSKSDPVVLTDPVPSIQRSCRPVETDDEEVMKRAGVSVTSLLAPD